MRSGARAVIAGAGLMGRWHADSVRKTGGQVAAVVDRVGEVGRALAARYGCRHFRDLTAALDAECPDVVHVCTPLETHAELCLKALEAGCHVLVEKPVAPTAGETRRVLDAAATEGLSVVPVYQFLFQDGVLDVLERLEALGPLAHLRGTALSAGARGLPESERDRIAVRILPHFLALAAHFLERRIADLPFEVEHPDSGELLVTTGSGPTSVSIFVSMSGRPTRNTLEIFGGAASAYVDLYHGFATWERGGPSRAYKVARPFTVSAARLVRSGANLARRALRREPAYPGLRELVRRTHATAMGSSPPPIPAEETLDVATAWHRIASML